jgi:hypothetical protein
MQRIDVKKGKADSFLLHVCACAVDMLLLLAQKGLCAFDVLAGCMRLCYGGCCATVLMHLYVTALSCSELQLLPSEGLCALAVLTGHFETLPSGGTTALVKLRSCDVDMYCLSCSDAVLLPLCL